MWLQCCKCGKQFEIFGEQADRTRAFYTAQPNHTPDKEVGVCDECWDKVTRDRPPTPAAKRRRFRFSLRAVFLVVTTLAIVLAVGAWKFRQDASREMALGALRNLGMQTSIASLPGNRTTLSLTCQSADFNDRQIEPFLAQIATLKRTHDLGMSPGMDLIQLDVANSSISSEGEHALRQALPQVEIKR